MVGASTLGCLVHPVSWIRCPWWPCGRRIGSRLRGGLGGGRVVLVGTLSMGGCVGLWPLCVPMSSLAVCESVLGSW